MGKEKNTEAWQLPTWVEKQLKARTDRPVPAFDAAWLDREPSLIYEEKALSGKVLRFPGRMFLAAAASLLIALGVFYLYPYLIPTEAGGTEIFASATGLGVRLSGPEGQKEGWNMGGLQAGTTIQTGEETLDLITSTGILLRLYPNSHLSIKAMDEVMELEQHQGRILAEVRPGEQGKSLRLLVKTPQTEVKVTGTVFSLEVGPDSSLLYLERGSLTMDEKTVQAGEIAEMAASELVKRKESARSAEIQEELASLRSSTDQLVRKWIPEMKRLDQVREEHEIKRMYGQSLEKIILKDGRILQGVVAAQEGDRLMLHTTTGVVVVRRQDVQEILYEN
ncbi:MAG: FecR domain-containing protein [Leptospiraceae bacterium]|nr:FecR domain-containing protein [Leptospiraceae bacterium]